MIYAIYGMSGMSGIIGHLLSDNLAADIKTWLSETVSSRLSVTLVLMRCKQEGVGSNFEASTAPLNCDLWDLWDEWDYLLCLS